MKRIIAKRTIWEFCEKYPDSKNYLKTWYETVKGADWKTPNEIKEFYSTALVKPGLCIGTSL